MEVYEKSADKDVYRSACVGALFKLKSLKPGDAITKPAVVKVANLFPSLIIPRSPLQQ
jgi:hypothetical protein